MADIQASAPEHVCHGRLYFGEYGEENGGGGNTSRPPPAQRARVAPQARPTIAEEEQPREAMPVADAAADRAWAQAHIND